MDDPLPPEWVTKRDGRQVPFEADRISRALFAATEGLGRPDAFLARELADGVVHFLALESEGEALTTARIEEVVVTIVRELGQPELAAAFAEHARRRTRGPAKAESIPARHELTLPYAPGAPLAEVLASCARAYTLQAVFARDLAAAHASGLLALTGLEAPEELAGVVLGSPESAEVDVRAALERARCFAGRVALDGPEYLLAGGEGGPHPLVEALRLGLRLTGLEAVVNLNSATPPSWAGDLAAGPLFAGRRQPERARLSALADGLFEELLRAGPGANLRLDWHLGEADFRPEGRDRLLRVVAALEGGRIGLVFDRPRRPVALAEGMNRQHPAVLLAVGLNLPALARQPGMGRDPSAFLQRLGSLARLALSAAVQKRAFLRRQERGRPTAAPALSSGFLLDRARLMVVPLGLDAVVAELTGGQLAEGGAALDLARQVVLRLREVLRQDGRAVQMDACVDGPFDLALAEGGDLAGLSPRDATAPARAQIRAAGALHSAAEHGTLALALPEEADAEQVAKWLRAAWQAEVVRLRLVKGSERAGLSPPSAPPG
jgi:hypothetical protein